MNCKACKLALRVDRAEPSEDGGVRLIYQCKNPGCEEYRRDIESGLQPETAADK